MSGDPVEVTGLDQLDPAVHPARDAGDSWTVIASELDTTCQAAQQRFGGN
jgi:hypothetical protein